MYSFSDFLAERATTKKADVPVEKNRRGQSNDDKGKLAEIQLAHHLGKHLVGEGERYYPSHYRGEEGTPQQIESGIVGRAGTQHQEASDRHSEQTSNAIIEHLIKTGRIRDRNDIQGVHWTSNADRVTSRGNSLGDHAKLTGHFDPNQKGDLIVTTRTPEGGSDYIPISSKYGSQPEPNYAGWGLDRLGKEAGMEAHPETGLNPLEQIKAEQEQELEQKLGRYHGSAAGATSAEGKHDLFRPDRNAYDTESKAISAAKKEHAKQIKTWTREANKAKAAGLNPPPKPKPPSEKLSPGAQRAKMAYDIALKHRRRMADTLAAAINKKVADAGHDGPIRDWISKAISEPTKFKTVIAHSHTDKNNPHGDANSVVYDQDDVAPHILDQYEGLQARVGRGEEGQSSEDGAISVHFYGKHKKTGQWERVATQDLKGQNGPYKGTNGAFKIQNAKHQEDDQSNEPVPQNHQVADSQSGAPVEVDPHVPDSATVDSPAARRKQRYRASLQQTAAASGGASESPFISRPRPGFASFRQSMQQQPQQQQTAPVDGMAQRQRPGINTAQKPIDPHEHKQYRVDEVGGQSWRGPGE